MRAVSMFVLTVVMAAVAFGQQTKPKTPPPTPQPGKPVVIPTRYDDDRFIATPVTTTNLTLDLFTDSAGGLFFYDDVVDRLGLPVSDLAVTKEGSNPVRYFSLPAFRTGADIPPPLGSDEQRIYIIPRPQSEGSKSPAIRDGMLGQQWFAGRVWTFDYAKRRLLWQHQDEILQHDKRHMTELYFKIDQSGKRQANFARMAVKIDGETMDFLFDTGATNILPEDVLKQIGDNRPADRATSFMVRSLFEKLRARHPEWRYLDKVKTRTGTAMLEVPLVTIGGFAVGPVWFTIQPDFAFQVYMAQFMDKPTQGAIGGTALRYLRVTVDWPRGLASFEWPQ